MRSVMEWMFGAVTRDVLAVLTGYGVLCCHKIVTRFLAVTEADQDRK